MQLLHIIKQVSNYVAQLPASLKWHFWGALVILAIGVGAGSFAPLVLRHVMNSLENTHNALFVALLGLLIMYGISWTVNQIATPLVWIMFQRPAYRTASMICQDTFSHVMHLSTEFYMTQDSRKAITAIERTFQTIPYLFSNIIIYFIPSITELTIAFFVFTYLFGVLYGLLLILLIASFMLCTWYISYKVDEPDRRYNDKLNELTNHIAEAVINFETIKLFTSEESEAIKIKTLLREFEDVSSVRALHLDGIQAVQTLICGVTVLIFTCLSGYAVYNGTLKAGDFVLINSYLMRFITPLTWLGYTIAEIYRGISNLQNTFELQTIKLPTYEQAKDTDFSDTSITFDQVSFEHGDRKDILKDVSFTIPAGKTLALIGSSGSGKSTCAKLLLRMYEPSKGSINIGGTPLTHITPFSLRQQIGVVPQAPKLLQGTILENIRYSNPEASDDEIKRAIAFASLEDFVKQLPLGLETPIHDPALQLSGGERQRIALARAIVKHPKILVFDEATSAVDLQTEYEMQKSIATLCKDTTCLIITHRLALASSADIIIVLKDGMVAEKGSHDQLMAKKRLYFHLWEQQYGTSE